MNIRTALSAPPVLFGLLFVSIGMFFAKGLRYAWLDSYLPLVLVGGVAVLLIIGWGTSPRNFRRAVRVWGVLLILWASGRFFIEALFQVAPVTEAHIRDQFTLVQNLLSLATLAAGIHLFRQAKTL